MDLLECEGVLLRRAILRLAVGCALVMVFALLALVGVCFMVWGFYLYAAQTFGPPAGGFLTGALFFAAAGVVLWTAKKHVR